MEEIKIFQLAERYHKLFPKKDMLAIQKNGVLKTYSTEDYIETTNNIAYGFKSPLIADQPRRGGIAPYNPPITIF